MWPSMLAAFARAKGAGAVDFELQPMPGKGSDRPSRLNWFKSGWRDVEVSNRHPGSAYRWLSAKIMVGGGYYIAKGGSDQSAFPSAQPGGLGAGAGTAPRIIATINDGRSKYFPDGGRPWRDGRQGFAEDKVDAWLGIVVPAGNAAGDCRFAISKGGWRRRLPPPEVREGSLEPGRKWRWIRRRGHVLRLVLLFADISKSDIALWAEGVKGRWYPGGGLKAGSLSAAVKATNGGSWSAVVSVVAGGQSSLGAEFPSL